MPKILGKIGLLVLALVAGAAWLVILRLKSVPVPLLVVYGLLLAASAAGTLWPGVLGRRRVLTFLGVPAGVATFGLYLAVVYHVTDLPVLLALAAVACLASAVPRGRRRADGGATRPSRRVFLAGGAGLALGALSALAAGHADRRRRDLLTRGEAQRQAAIRAPGARRRIADGKVRVFPIHTGDTIVTYGQFYGGLDGWEGLNGYLRTLLDKAQIAVPVHAYLIDHPRHGLMLVDTGVNWEQAHDHDGYYGITSRLLTERDEYRLTPAQDLRVRLARLGYDAGDVTTVFLTHVHDDHAGGLRHLPRAEVVLDRRDWDQGVLYPHSFDLVKERLSFPAFDSGAFGAFPAAQDHFGDGSVVLLPAPGHSPGHMCVLLRLDGGGSALFLGDTLYTLPHLATDQVRQMTIGGADTVHQIEAARRVQRLLAADPGLVPLFAHDNTRYQSDLVTAAFTDGSPGEAGLRELRRHMEAVLTPGWRLRPGHTPHFVPPASGTGPGRVEFR
ncbi:N-acyl homoserine lactonase family protein [Spongiactinospora sp. TRM90649]|uniref:N-acyl homoserine lactonase family protein n=1 Tax=Spongiactinospora sp. TRM90649 TaxID=3031114 RepID=UPI0023F81F05|nr:N-acyl homoserine lactonase family protein [Spongiactinospora sp. TRM90649]MDF5758841.1 N-acyl homoserine lactonase family protein [Spongiactinospora sp. TRM90649]